MKKIILYNIDYNYWVEDKRIAKTIYNSKFNYSSKIYRAKIIYPERVLELKSIRDFPEQIQNIVEEIHKETFELFSVFIYWEENDIINNYLKENYDAIIFYDRKLFYNSKFKVWYFPNGIQQ